MERQIKKDRVIIENGIKKCFCSLEDVYKPCEEFSIRKQQLGFQYYCNSCLLAIKNGELEPNTPIYVREGANFILTSMGYKINSDQSIHQQFKKKHNLK